MSTNREAGKESDKERDRERVRPVVTTRVAMARGCWPSDEAQREAKEETGKMKEWGSFHLGYIR